MKFFWLIWCHVLMLTKCNDAQYPNMTLISEELSDGKNFTCILEGNSLQSAITWNTPIENYPFISESRYLPDSITSCNYADGKIDNKICGIATWTLEKSVNFNFKPIMDYRWERFPIIYIESVPKQIFTFSETKFSIALSFRIKDSAWLFLCSTQQEWNSECFVMLIEKTAIRIYSQINNKSKTVLDKKDINTLKEDEWANLIISFICTENTNILKLKIEDVSCTGKIEGNSFNTSYLSIRTHQLSSWKLHDYRFLSTNKVTGSKQIGKKMKTPLSKPFCVSLFVALCRTCIMNIQLYANMTPIHSEEVKNSDVNDEEQNELYSWREIKIIVNISRSSYKTINLYLIPCNTNGSKKGFWAIDNLRLCNANEIRVANFILKNDTKKPVQCKPIHQHFQNVSDITNEASCENSKIGAHCNITCESIFGKNEKNCERKLICNRNGASSKCHCAPGYRGSTCKNKCSKGAWGAGCNNKCYNCQNDNCHHIVGTCNEGCAEGFDTPPYCTYPTTVQNIRETSITSNSITIEWDFPSSNLSIFSYIVIYKHKKYRACQNDEKNTPSKNMTTTNKRAVIEKLLPYSEYHFEVAAIHNNMQGNITNFTTSTSFTDTPNSEEVPIEIRVSYKDYENSPLLILNEPPCSNIKGPLIYEATFTCSNKWCEKPINHSITRNNDFDYDKNLTFNVNDLIPYSKYTIIIRSKRKNSDNYAPNNYANKFETKKAKPPKVSDLMAYSRNETTISLRWKAPYPPYGILEKYKIICTDINPCESFEICPKLCDLWKGSFTCADIRNLNKNNTYTVAVAAKNKNVSEYGEAAYQENILTQEDESEAPSIVEVIYESESKVKLQWNHPSITNGPLRYFNIQINVIRSDYLNYNSFSTKYTITKYNQTYSKELDLKGSSVYNVIVYPINKYKGKPSNSISIKTPIPTPKLKLPPIINCTDLKCKLKIPQRENISNSSCLYVVIEKADVVQQKQNLVQFLENCPKNQENQTNWLAIAMLIGNITDDWMKVKLGDYTNTTCDCVMAINNPLLNDTDYVITVILANHFQNETRFSETYPLYNEGISMRFHNTQADTTNFALYALLLILLIPIAVCGWIIYNRRNKPKTSNETIRYRLLFSNCFQGNSTASEDLPLHVAEKGKKVLQQPKPIGIVKPKSLDLVNATSPLLSQLWNENILPTHKVKLENFEEYVKQSIGTYEEEGELVRQHNLFIRGQTKPWDYGQRKENRFKNRYNNLMAYDHSRVKLEKINNDEFSDYINANYINGYKQPKAYIATQGPKPTTVCDFWRMVWQECATTIVMVANVEEEGKKKTEEYWPKLNCSLTFGSIEVYHKKSEIYSNYVFRTLIVTKGSEERIIEQLHFTSWPDHGVPLYPQTLVPFIEKVRTVPQDTAPVIIHCSAGVGRTGTIILCDYILRMAEAEGAVDFLATLQEMREQRANLVDNPEQYKLAHLVVLETLFGLDSTLPCNYELEEKVEKLIHSNDLYTQIEYLEKTVWQDQTMSPSYRSIPDPANKNKNRFSNIVPDGYGRIYISRYPVIDEHADYINAIEVDGFQIPKRFIVTQQPLPTTVLDFWRMVSEKDITTIVSLNDITPCDQSSCIFWPEKDETLDLKFALVNYVDKDEYITHENLKLILLNKSDEQTDEYGRQINLIKMKDWPSRKTIPNKLDSLIETWNEVDKLSRGNNPIIVTCYDGATASGIFVALSFVIEKIKLEQVCDVCLAVRIVRRSRKEFVTNVEQFQLLYKAAVRYLKGFETYSNFPIANK